MRNHFLLLVFSVPLILYGQSKQSIGIGVITHGILLVDPSTQDFVKYSKTTFATIDSDSAIFYYSTGRAKVPCMQIDFNSTKSLQDST